MAKSKHTPERRAIAAQEYLDGKSSVQEIARKYNCGETTIKRWIIFFREQGISAFINTGGNKRYSAEFKIKCVELYITGKLSVSQIAAQYKISNQSVLRSWIKKYNSNMELKDYDPKQEVYMASARRKTTIDERKEIVAYCVEHNNDYKGTAARFDVSYAQVYTWVMKYNANGEAGLQDKRGHHKQDEELNELERLRRENLRLKRQLQEQEMVVELLKKVKEFEGM